MINKPQFGALMGADVDKIGGRILMLEGHAAKLDEALDAANAQLAEREERIATLERELKAARAGLSKVERRLAEIEQRAAERAVPAEAAGE